MTVVAELNDETRRRLALLVSERRKTLSLSVSAAARAAGIDRGTWTGLEKGIRETEEYNYSRIERVLGWAPGSIDDIMDGGEPTIQQQPEAPAPGRRVELPSPLPSDEAITRVMQSANVPESEKPRIIAILIADREREQQRRLALAEDLMRDYENAG